jgi:hypothetical protein
MMSDDLDLGAELDDRPHSAATDPHGTIQADQPEPEWHPARPVTDAEREHNAKVLGVTYRERYKPRDHDRCIILCVSPAPERMNRCPSCYGKAVPYDVYQSGFEPMPGRAERFGRLLGEWAAALVQAFRYPFQRDADHYRALVIDTLQDAIQAGLRAEVTQVCPRCEAGEAGGEA